MIKLVLVDAHSVDEYEAESTVIVAENNHEMAALPIPWIDLMPMLLGNENFVNALNTCGYGEVGKIKSSIDKFSATGEIFIMSNATFRMDVEKINLNKLRIMDAKTLLSPQSKLLVAVDTKSLKEAAPEAYALIQSEKKKAREKAKKDEEKKKARAEAKKAKELEKAKKLLEESGIEIKGK